MAEQSPPDSHTPPPEHQEYFNTISRRLFWLSIVVVVCVIAIIVFAKYFFALIILSFLCGVGGSLMSIQTRLGRLETYRLRTLASSTVASILPALHGGLFAVILYVLFITGILQGPLFPAFANPEAFAEGQDNFALFFAHTNPVGFQDIAKVLFWSFAAGYVERFVPNLVGGLSARVGKPEKAN